MKATQINGTIQDAQICEKEETKKMTEEINRPEKIKGTTYKIKTPKSDHALYITINDVVLNEGTPTEKTHPFEIFINTKNMDEFQWITALTMTASGVFRKGGDIRFLIDGWKEVFDPHNGYYKKGVFMPSVVAHIATVLEDHLHDIGYLEKEETEVTDELKQKRLEHGYKEETQMPNAKLCKKCRTQSVVMMNGCETCLSCGESKCG